MSTHAGVHVISKANIAEHNVVELPTSSPEALKDGHVRVRTVIIGLTANNLSYAQLGTMRAWWDAYPVPASLPAPYNDQQQYGIVPAWGYGEVLESKVAGIEAGMLLWGFWPTSSLPIDLELVPADAFGHFVEVSKQRQTLMNLYQRYTLRDPSMRLKSLDNSATEHMAFEAACRPIWEAGYLLNKANFGDPPAHPLGEGEWSNSDADLSSAVVISLSASGKTARGFTDGLINNRPASAKPLGLLGITSVSGKEVIPQAPFPTRSTSYEDMISTETLDWIAGQKPKKLVITDFGGRNNALARLLDGIEKYFKNSVEVVVIGVGGDPSLHTQEQLGQWAQRNMSLANRVQMNTSGIRDALMKAMGAKVYFNDQGSAWEKFVSSESAKDMKLEMHRGVKGDDGFEGGWTRACEGKLLGDVALAYVF